MILYSKEPFQNSRIDLLAQQFIDYGEAAPSDFFLICPYSIGDFYHTMVLVDAFRAHHCTKGQKIHMVCTTRCIPLAQLFCNVEYCIGTDCNPHFIGLEAFAQRYQFGQGLPYLPEPDMHSRGWLTRLVAHGKITQMEAKKIILEMDIDAPITSPKLDESRRPQVNAHAQSQGLKPGSVIIFNHAKTAAPIDSDIFRALIPYFGDNIFYDATGTAKNSVPWAKPLEINLEDIPYFAEYAGNVVAVRSGIVDLLSFTECNLLTFYPNAAMVNSWWQDRQYGADLIWSGRLKYLGLRTHRPEITLRAKNGDTKEDIMKAMANLVEQFT